MVAEDEQKHADDDHCSRKNCTNPWEVHVDVKGGKCYKVCLQDFAALTEAIVSRSRH